MAKKAPAKKVAQEKFDQALAELKANHEGQTGGVSAVMASPGLRRVAEAWPTLDHRQNPERMLGSGTVRLRAWSAYSLPDYTEAADACGLDSHVFLRMLRRGSSLGVIFPDGTVHPRVERYLQELTDYAVVPAPKS